MTNDLAYEKAEKVIEQELRSKTGELYLRNLGLDEIPKSLGDLTHLRKLYLSNNNLTRLPTHLSQLTKLDDLDISHNHIEILPEFIGNLNSLEVLNLSNNQLREISDTLTKLSKLFALNLYKNNIEKLPEHFGDLTKLNHLNIQSNKISRLPDTFGKLSKITNLNLFDNNLSNLPDTIERLTNLQVLSIAGNKITLLPECIRKLSSLTELWCSNNKISFLPEWVGELKNITKLILSHNELSDLPISISYLNKLQELNILGNPLNLELVEASRFGLDAIKIYLRAKGEEQYILNEAKLILVGEGEVGKTCLMDALLNNPWKEHPSTHGIEIQQAKLTDSKTQKEITLNGWDFGGQRVYRPTHQLFFSAPAVYLVVWKPREGPQQGFVKEWIQLIKRREPSAKILVVATHGGPQQRQPDIDRQELWDLFGKETVIDFFFVDSKPDENEKRKGIEELKEAIAKVASELPEVGRSVPKSFVNVRKVLQEKNVPYLPFIEVLAICRENKMHIGVANLFIRISHQLGHLTYYENDPILKDIVILRPDWLATAMSYILDDEETRKKNGLVNFSHLSQLWNDPSRPPETRYPQNLHKIFMKLMERFDLSYRVKGISPDEETNPVSLIAQLVPDNNPEESKMDKAWGEEIAQGDIQQTQICRIVDAQTGHSANAEGIFYQLIVRLHKYSLGREHYDNSVHWQRGLVLDADYNGRAILRHVGNDIHITVRAPYPERFLAMLTEEVKYLVESFWEGLRCDVTVPCLNENPCMGLFEVEKLVENKKRGRPEMPCPICNEWQNINQLLLNAPVATKAIPLDVLMKEFSEVKDKLDIVNDNTKRILSQVDKQYSDFIKIFTDEANEGPRLFSFFPLDINKLNPQTWVREKFRLVLWCEHSRLPLPLLNNGNMQKGVYDLEFERTWFRIAAPYLKFLTGTLSLVLPVASSTLKVVHDSVFKTIENQLSLSKNVIDAIAGTGTALNEIMGKTDSTSLERGVGIRAENSTLRELHAMLKAKDPGFGGLVRVMNKRQEFLWVHEKYASEY